MEGVCSGPQLPKRAEGKAMNNPGLDDSTLKLVERFIAADRYERCWNFYFDNMLSYADLAVIKLLDEALLFHLANQSLQSRNHK